MFLDLVRLQDKDWPQIEDPDKYTSVRVWFCKYRTLDAISYFQNLKNLVIAGFPDPSLVAISRLTELEYLRILHLPKITSLAGIEKLKNLESLSLSTAPSWDSSGKRTEVDSLAPVGTLEKLKHIELFGVCQTGSSLSELESCSSLVTGRFNKYPKGVAEQFIEKMGLKNQFVPEPVLE